MKIEIHNKEKAYDALWDNLSKVEKDYMQDVIKNFQVLTDKREIIENLEKETDCAETSSFMMEILYNITNRALKNALNPHRYTDVPYEDTASEIFVSINFNNIATDIFLHYTLNLEGKKIEIEERITSYQDIIDSFESKQHLFSIERIMKILFREDPYFNLTEKEKDQNKEDVMKRYRYLLANKNTYYFQKNYFLKAVRNE